MGGGRSWSRGEVEEWKTRAVGQSKSVSVISSSCAREWLFHPAVRKNSSQAAQLNILRESDCDPTRLIIESSKAKSRDLEGP